jgi:hypothetical protein
MLCSSIRVKSKVAGKTSFIRFPDFEGFKKQRAPPIALGKRARCPLFSSLFSLRIFGDATMRQHTVEKTKPTSLKRKLFFDNREEGKQSPCHTPICSNISSLVIQASCFVWAPVWLSGFSPLLLSILIVHTPFPAATNSHPSLYSLPNPPPLSSLCQELENLVSSYNLPTSVSNRCMT